MWSDFMIWLEFTEEVGVETVKWMAKCLVEANSNVERKEQKDLRVAPHIRDIWGVSNQKIDYLVVLNEHTYAVINIRFPILS